MVNRDTERPKIKPMTKEITMFLVIGTCILRNLEDINYMRSATSSTSHWNYNHYSLLESEFHRCNHLKVMITMTIDYGIDINVAINAMIALLNKNK